jgi:hypothetical protein
MKPNKETMQKENGKSGKGLYLIIEIAGILFFPDYFDYLKMFYLL